LLEAQERAHVLGTRLAASSGVAKRAFSFSLQWSATNAINEENAVQNTHAKETQRTLYGFRGVYVFDRLSRDLWCGRRDYALLLTMYNLGARVSEISGLRQSHVTFGANSYVQLHGKGRKDRSIPLWPRTARILKDLFRELGQPEQAMAFPSIRGEPLTRFAIHLLLRKAVDRASARCGTLKKKRVSPHIVRHGTAMALLQSGVDIAVIALWLGHESMKTTNAYLHANLAMKEKALAKVLPVGVPFRRFQANDTLLAFLESL
jgi:integrase/recombinase XerD